MCFSQVLPEGQRGSYAVSMLGGLSSFKENSQVPQGGFPIYLFFRTKDKETGFFPDPFQVVGAHCQVLL